MELKGIKNLWQARKNGEDSVIASNLFDTLGWQKAVEAIPSIGEKAEKAASDFVGDPMRDVYFGLHKRNPKMNPDAPETLSPLSKLIDIAQSTPKWQKLRSPDDSISASIGASAFTEDALRNLPDEVKEQMQKAKDFEEKAGELQAKAQGQNKLAELFENLLEKIDETKQPQKAKELKQKAETAKKQAAELQAKSNAKATYMRKAIQKSNSSIEKQQAQITHALDKAADKAAEKASQESSFIRAFTEASGGDPENLSIADVESAMKVLSEMPELKNLADKLGWAKKIARGEWHKKAGQQGDIVGFKRNPLHISTMATPEFVAMSMGDESPLGVGWLMRVAGGKVLHKDFSAKEKTGKGAIIFVVDESGSMSEDASLCKGIEWALLDIARKENRPFVSIAFSSNFKVWQPSTNPDPVSLAEHMTSFLGGGTIPYPALEKAIELSSGGLDADIVFLTDGSFREPTPHFLTLLESTRNETPLHITGISVSMINENLETICDTVMQDADLTNEKVLKGIVKNLN